MSFGDMTTVVANKFSEHGTLTGDLLNALYHVGRLTPLLPDQSCWHARLDEDGDVAELAIMRTTEAGERFPCPINDGALVVT